LRYLEFVGDCDGPNRRTRGYRVGVDSGSSALEHTHYKNGRRRTDVPNVTARFRDRSQRNNAVPLNGTMCDRGRATDASRHPQRSVLAAAPASVISRPRHHRFGRREFDEFACREMTSGALPRCTVDRHVDALCRGAKTPPKARRRRASTTDIASEYFILKSGFRFATLRFEVGAGLAQFLGGFPRPSDGSRLAIAMGVNTRRQRRGRH
jgi:hypothetical protein